jgi:Histidine kinase-, DNA gyrase B-, and HSP90-like ATPase
VEREEKAKEMNPITVRLRADVPRLIRNIVNFFGSDNACIQEMLQNARRAKAKNVRIRIDKFTNTLEFEDDGRGIKDPQTLLSVAESDWEPDVQKETPAGMGFFSIFRVAEKLSVRSKKWEMLVDYPAMLKGADAQTSQKVENQVGTKLRASLRPGMADKLTDPGNMHEWRANCQIMPFATELTIVNGKLEEKLEFEAFYPQKLGPRVAYSQRKWGLVVLKSGDPDPTKLVFGSIIIQGVRLPMRELGVDDYNLQAKIGVMINTGELNLRLPDRQHIIRDEKYEEIRADFQKAIIELCKEKEEFADRGQIAFGVCPQSILELDDDALITKKRAHDGYTNVLVKDIRANSKTGLLVNRVYNEIEELGWYFLQKSVMDFDDTTFRKIAQNTSPNALVKSAEMQLVKDPRHPRLFQLTHIRVTTNDGVTKLMTPEPNLAIAGPGAMEHNIHVPDKNCIIHTFGPDSAVVFEKPNYWEGLYVGDWEGSLAQAAVAATQNNVPRCVRAAELDGAIRGLLQATAIHEINAAFQIEQGKLVIESPMTVSYSRGEVKRLALFEYDKTAQVSRLKSS